MKIVRWPLIGIVSTLFILNLSAQEKEVLTYTPPQIEALFMAQNLQLIAEKMNIGLVDAEISQAKRWDNPELSIGSVNFWGTQQQREELDMTAFPKNTQFSIELSQLIQTARKRSKLVNMTKVSREMAIREFEDVLRGLKVELRKLIAESIYLQSYLQTLAEQQTSMELLITAYTKQVSRGNIAKPELLRLQSELLALQSEINETRVALNEQQKNLKSLLSIPTLTPIKIELEKTEMPTPDPLWMNKLFDIALDARPDLKREELQTLFFEKSLTYEKAKRIPDITLNANYDKYGGIWKDFIGLGVSIELPILNRNQGNIKAAEIGMLQSRYLATQQQNMVKLEIAQAFENYALAYDFYQKVSENDLLSELESISDLYAKNLLNRNISMLEYIDFMEAYKSNKQTLLSAQKDRTVAFSELQYCAGTDLQ